MIETSKCLGIVINSSLDRTGRTNLISRKVSKTIGILKCLRIYYGHYIFALVNPYYEYENIVWAVRNTAVLQKLFISQKKRYSDDYKFFTLCSYRPFFRSLRILKIEELHKLQVTCFVII